MSKVLVFAAHKEALAKTGRRWNEFGNEEVQFRQFTPKHQKALHGEAYMTPDEARFLVESKENRKHADGGSPHYWYPSGMPIPVPDEQDGDLMPPITEASSHINDGRQVEAAQELLVEREKAMKDAAEKRELDGDPPIIQAEPRGRGKRNR